MVEPSIIQSRIKAFDYQSKIYPIIKQICLPLRLMDLHAFIHCKFYLESDNMCDRVLMISNNLETSSFITFEVFEHSQTFTNVHRSTKLNKVSYFFWTTETDDPALLKIFSKINLSSGVTICKRFEGAIKTWSFGIENDNLNAFFNNNALIKLTQFVNYFENSVLTLKLEEEDCCLHFPFKTDLSVKN